MPHKQHTATHQSTNVVACQDKLLTTAPPMMEQYRVYNQDYNACFSPILLHPKTTNHNTRTNPSSHSQT
jgi:hypothetical protein